MEVEILEQVPGCRLLRRAELQIEVVDDDLFIKMGIAGKHGEERIEETLYQTKNQSRQDPLNYPVKLNNKLSALVWKSSMGDARPTDSQVKVKQNVIGLINEQLIELERIMQSQLPAFNELVRQAGVPARQVP